MKAPEHEASWYVKFTLVAIAYFNILHLLVHFLAYRFIQLYRDMSLQKKTEYRTYIISPIHAFAAVFMSTWAMWFVCGDSKTVFNSHECINTVRYVDIWATLHTCGYFITDFFLALLRNPGSYQLRLSDICTPYRSCNHFLSNSLLYGLLCRIRSHAFVHRSVDTFCECKMVALHARTVD